MSEETIEQAMARLKRQDEEKERAWQKRRKELEAEAQRYRAQKEQEQREKELAVEKLHEDLRQKREQEMKDDALRPWLDAGGTHEEFEQAWPEIRDALLFGRALGGVSATRAASFRHAISGF